MQKFCNAIAKHSFLCSCVLLSSLQLLEDQGLTRSWKKTFIEKSYSLSKKPKMADSRNPPKMARLWCGNYGLSWTIMDHQGLPSTMEYFDNRQTDFQGYLNCRTSFF